MKNPYEILGVSQNATEQEITKAYRKLAKQYHPDRNPGDDEALEKYKEIANAYEQITNPKPTHNVQDFDASEVFGDFFSQVFNFGNFGQRQQQVNMDVHVNVSLDFWEAANGCEKTITVQRAAECLQCQGTGAAEVETCNICRGSGHQVRRQGNFTLQTSCSGCQGRGEKVIKPCEVCTGRGWTREDIPVPVKFPEGTVNEMAVLVHGQGNTFGGRTGNLYVIAQVNPHNVFIRQLNNLCYRMPVQYSVLVNGGKIKVPTLKEEIEVEVPPNTKSGTVLTVRDKGFRSPQNGKYGSLMVEVMADTVNPSDVELEYKTLIDALHNWEKDNITPNMKKFYEECKKP